MASYKNCLVVLLQTFLFIASCMSDKVIDEDSCSFNDEELAPPRTFQRSPHEINEAFIWPNGEIPYVFTYSVDQGDRKLIEANMRKIEKNSCFRFKKQYNNKPPTDRKYLEIEIPIGANSCADVNGRSITRHFSAYVSNKYLIQRPLRKNALLLKSEYKLTDKVVCKEMDKKGMYEGGILHEMFHALGVGHTQRRGDRDNYITVYSGNIEDPSQYAVCKDCKVYSDIPYECNSIMHYGYMTFAKGRNRPTMQAKYPSSCKIGKNGPKVPTRNDWKLIKRIGNTVCGSGGSISVGKWSDWENYGYCEGTCNRATQEQRRRCVGGSGCQGKSTQEVSCKKAGCGAGETSCKDNNTGCSSWAKYCTNAEYKEYMEKTCPKTCKVCSVCEHTDIRPASTCSQYKKLGFCTTYRWAARNCAKTCKC